MSFTNLPDKKNPKKNTNGKTSGLFPDTGRYNVDNFSSYTFDTTKYNQNYNPDFSPNTEPRISPFTSAHSKVGVDRSREAAYDGTSVKVEPVFKSFMMFATTIPNDPMAIWNSVDKLDTDSYHIKVLIWLMCMQGRLDTKHAQKDLLSEIRSVTHEAGLLHSKSSAYFMSIFRSYGFFTLARAQKVLVGTYITHPMRELLVSLMIQCLANNWDFLAMCSTLLFELPPEIENYWLEVSVPFAITPMTKHIIDASQNSRFVSIMEIVDRHFNAFSFSDVPPGEAPYLEFSNIDEVYECLFELLHASEARSGRNMTAYADKSIEVKGVVYHEAH